MVDSLKFACREGLAEFLALNSGPYLVRGSGGGDRFRTDTKRNVQELSFTGSEIVEISDADQVAVFEAGISLASVQRALEAQGQALPILAIPGLTSTTSLGGSLSLNLPHPLEGPCGSWRDWVLGLTAVLPNGEILKCGSKAVKNVAGYDMHKLFIGARGTLGVVVEVSVRTYPLARFRAVSETVARCVPPGPSQHLFIQRTLRKNFQEAKHSCGNVLLEDEVTSTLWVESPNGQLRRFSDDWILESGRAPKISSPAQRKMMLALKETFDPAAKLNPGEFEFL